jgi:tyrosyl-tRNA synthetase
MSKSLGNAIGINEPPAEMYGRLMSISDELMWKYWVLLTDLKQSEVDALQADVSAGKLHPMEVKKRLARSITADFHGEAAALSADENWAKMFQQKGESEDLEEVTIAYADVARIDTKDPDLLEVRLPKLLVRMGLVTSGTEANRKIVEGAVRVDGRSQGPVLYVERRVLPIQLVVRLGKRAKRAVIS